MSKLKRYRTFDELKSHSKARKEVIETNTSKDSELKRFVHLLKSSPVNGNKIGKNKFMK
ncbi:MAG: hypothetical protein ABI723_27000 [Bacteroidia bacterium]